MINLGLTYFIICIAFFGNFPVSLGILPPQVTWLTEPLVYLFFLISLATKKQRFRLPYLPLFLLLFVVAVGSSVLNGSLGLNMVFGMRLVFRFYFFFLGVVNAGFNEEQLKKLNKFLIIIFLIQIPTATVRFLIYGHGEKAIGTYARSAGSSSTTIPLYCIGFAMAFYFYYKPKVKYLIAALGFVGFGILGSKRALVFYMPVLFAFIAIMALKDSNAIKQRVPNFKSKLMWVSIVIVLITFIGGVKMMYSLTPEKEYGGSIDIGYIIEMALKYESKTKVEDERYTGGRFATTKQVFTVLFNEGPVRCLFGYGPGSYTETRFTDERSRYRKPIFKDLFIYYGVTALSFTAMEYGYLGVFCYIVFLLMVFRLFYRNWRRETDPYWKTISFGSLVFIFVFIMMWLQYSKQVLLGDYEPLIFYYLLGMGIIRKRVLAIQNSESYYEEYSTQTCNTMNTQDSFKSGLTT